MSKKQMGKYSTVELGLIHEYVKDNSTKTLAKIVSDLGSLLDRSEFSIESKVKELYPEKNRKPLPPTVPAVLPKRETLAERLYEHAAILERQAEELRKIAANVQIIEKWASDATVVRKIVYNIDTNGVIEVKK
jgi:hypothetical protein